MKCPNCKGAIPTDHKGRTCPSCGDPLPISTSILSDWGRRARTYTEERGFFFWLLVFALIVSLLAVIEHLLGPGTLARLLDHHKFVSLVMFIYAAAHLKVIRCINTKTRPGYPGEYWVDRLIIRKFRKGTNTALLVGFIVSVVVVGPFNVLSLMPAYILIMSLFTASFWSIDSFRIDDREFQDAKIRTYFEYLGVRRLRTLRKASGAYIICIVVSAATFYGLSQIENLWWMIKLNPTLNDIIDIINGLFDWVPMLFPAN
ncbi:hypothetical protein CEE37_12515 [candidate division LCP-89 bacterium B3_LCP]|uniref:Uncharacterized protein n=1 Tax=candidate division LCP-89 bacterium B3_LCP TaxID=2012998 RepID=A0A532UUG4_UNCL8|nr:MAG: hypothetical protein CEE37_12515 [candidate division LCP-89 bacterium B3_LCP]